MTTRPTGACLVLVTQVNMVRGPHPTEYCCGKLRAAPGQVALCRTPSRDRPPRSCDTEFKLRGLWKLSILGGDRH